MSSGRTGESVAATRAGLARAGRPAVHRLPLPVLVPVLVAVLAVSAIAALGIGAVALDPLEVLRVVGARLGGEAASDPVADGIVWELRAPRILLAALAGAGLAVIGAVVQGVTRNPLADPYLLGISSGAALGAVVVVALGAGAIGGPELAAGAFGGALAAFGLVLLVAQQRGRLAPVRTILAGVAIAELCAALTALVTLRETDAEATRSLLVWLLGGFAGTGWHDLVLPLAAVAGVLAVARADVRTLDALALGEETAASLGVATDRARLRLLVASALATAVLVAACGAVGFVGLIVPHAARYLTGGRHRRVLPVAALLGAVLAVWVDTLARTAFAPEEIPVGVVTAILGVPFFVLLLQRQGRAGT